MVNRVLSVTSECFPLIKTGGLADVAGALPIALEEQGFDVRTLLPAFPAVLKTTKSRKTLCKLPDFFGGSAKLMSAKSADGLKLFLLNAPHLYGDEGNPYQDDAGKDRANNHIRFAALSYAAAKLATGALTNWQAEIVHAHDWQAGLTALYLSLESGKKPKTVFTIHNLAFQGLFPPTELAALKIPKACFSRNGIEYWDKISFLKAGIVYSDAVTTVSPSYADEICSDDGGMGFGGLLSHCGDKLSGILNGIDTNIWNPETDGALTRPYSRNKLAGKAKNKRVLQEHFGLKIDSDAPLFCVISRLTEQKGLDLLAAAVPHIIGNGAQLIVLGSGEAKLEKAFITAAGAHSDHVGCFIGYDENLAHQIQGGADVIFIPSRFEPCGLTQLCAMRYGTLPLVARVGGLADTVIDANEMALQLGLGTGLQFSPVTEHALKSAIDRTLRLWNDKKTWRKLQKNAMNLDVSWRGPAASYAALYRRIAAK